MSWQWLRNPVVLGVVVLGALPMLGLMAARLVVLGAIRGVVRSAGKLNVEADLKTSTSQSASETCRTAPKVGPKVGHLSDPAAHRFS